MSCQVPSGWSCCVNPSRPARASGGLRRLVLQPRARRTREGAQSATAHDNGPESRGSGERVRRPREGNLGAADPQNLRSRSARLSPMQRPDARDRADRRSGRGAAASSSTSDAGRPSPPSAARPLKRPTGRVTRSSPSPLIRSPISRSEVRETGAAAPVPIVTCLSHFAVAPRNSGFTPF